MRKIDQATLRALAAAPALSLPALLDALSVHHFWFLRRRVDAGLLRLTCEGLLYCRSDDGLEADPIPSYSLTEAGYDAAYNDHPRPLRLDRL